MDKIKLRLCAGTMCYVMGGAQLMEIEELLSEEEKQACLKEAKESTDWVYDMIRKICRGDTQ